MKKFDIIFKLLKYLPISLQEKLLNFFVKRELKKALNPKKSNKLNDILGMNIKPQCKHAGVV